MRNTHEDFRSSNGQDARMASTFRRARAQVLRLFFRAHAEIYERSDGRIGATLGMPMLLLTTTGRVSALPRTTPLVYFRDRGALVVVGSDGGARRDPHWVKNLAKDATATVRVGRERFAASTQVATGAERERLWALGRTVNPMWQRYQDHTERELPVVVISRRV